MNQKHTDEFVPVKIQLTGIFFIGGEVMKNYKFGYARVSTEDQVLDRQIDMLSEYGVNQIYSEKMTGTKRNRPELEKLLDRLSEVRQPTGTE